MQNKKPIASYNDLEIFNESYDAAIVVIKTILPTIPSCERFDLVDQLRRSSKAIPRLIAEGYAKRHQNRGFQKYLDDAMAECNETCVGLKQCRDIYGIKCDELISIYETCGKRIYRLAHVWTSFKSHTLLPSSSLKPASQPISQPLIPKS